MPLFERKVEATPVLECPHDGKAMRKIVVDDVTVDQCDGCGGTWFDKHELRRVAHDKELEALATRVPIVKQASPFRCPRCQGECVEGHISEVEIDHCLACEGVWLDRGELREAQRQLQAERLIAGTGLGFRAFLGRL